MASFSKTFSPSSIPWLRLGGIIALVGLFFIALGTPPLFVPDEGRYAEIAREMASLNDFVTPYLNYIKYFEKPPLYYWLAAFMIKMAGPKVVFIRAINASLGLLGIFATYWLCLKFFNRRTALLASSVLATSPLYLLMSRMITLDLTVTFFISICLYSFIYAIFLTESVHPEHPAHRNNAQVKATYFFWLAAASAGAAVLTKGLIGIVFPGLIVLAWLSFCRKWQLIKQMPLVTSFIVFMGVVLPWHLLVMSRNPEFFYFYFIEQHFLRYTLKDIGHYQPIWYFIPVLILGFFPWVCFIPNAIKSFLNIRDKTHNPYLGFFLLWFLIIFLFFSFSKSKLIPYILPLFPPAAILIAFFIEKALQKKEWLWIRIGVLMAFAGNLTIAITYYLFPQHVLLPSPETASYFLNVAALCCVLGSCLSVVLIIKRPMISLSILIMTMALFILFSLLAVPAIDSRTILPIANLLKTRLKSNEEVITYNQYYQDLPFYLERQVSILNWRNELSFGMEHQNTHSFMINDRQFWQRLNSPKRTYFVISRGEFEQLVQRHPFKRFYVLGETLTTILVSNKPDETDHNL